MPDTHTVRLLTPDDARAYSALRREMLDDAPWAYFRSPEDDPGCKPDSVAAELASTDRYAIAGAFTNDAGSRLVAAAGIVRSGSLKTAHRAVVWGVYTSPSHRGRGLARAVIAAAIDGARAWRQGPGVPPIQAVTLSVSERSVGACALYISMGFVPWGTEPDVVRIGAERYAETHMHMDLSNPR
ncbi:MAG TPA: GNAT family N-acetyltransferase [Phycisphaerales bacterium]|nr:GNAT family N-acetyltransferase [Phycisphaerales bacterium]